VSANLEFGRRIAVNNVKIVSSFIHSFEVRISVQQYSYKEVLFDDACI